MKTILRFARPALALAAGSLALLPVTLMALTPMAQVGRDLAALWLMIEAKLNPIMLLTIAVAAAATAPRLLAFRQDCAAENGVTPSFARCERVEPGGAIVLAVVSVAALMGFCASVFAGGPETAALPDPAAGAAILARYADRLPDALSAIVLIDAGVIGVIGAAAASLFLAGAVGEALALRDRAVPGRWARVRPATVFSGAVIVALLTFSAILTASALWPDVGEGAISAMRQALAAHA